MLLETDVYLARSPGMSSTTADPEPAEVSTSCPEPATFAVQEPAVAASAESAPAAEDLADSCDKKLSVRIQPHVVVTAAAVETVVRKQRCHVDSCGEELSSRAQLRAHLRQVTETLAQLCGYLLHWYAEESCAKVSQLLMLSFIFTYQLEKFKFVVLFDAYV
jgi:hypothetical protein